MPSVFIFSSELSEEIFIENESNRFNFGLILKSKNQIWSPCFKTLSRRIHRFKL